METFNFLNLKDTNKTKNKKMIRLKKEGILKKNIIIDLTGPYGNVFALMAFARRFAIQLNWVDEGSNLINDMMSHDYEHAIQAFDNAFGEFVILER
jgi:hypothetical protein